MRTIIFITESNDSAALAKRIQELGDRVILESSLFTGPLYNPEVLSRVIKERPELIIMDSDFEASTAAKTEFEKMGIPVYGTSLFSKSATKNPAYISKILNINGIKTEAIPKDTIPLTYSVVLNGKNKVMSSVFYEYVYLMNDDVGPPAYMGSIGYFGDISAIDQKMSAMVNALIKSGFSGKIDFQLRLGEDAWCAGVYFYFRWNTIYALLENINMSPSEFFYQCSMNEPMRLKIKSPWSCQINCGVPPFPYNLEREEEAEIRGIDSNNSKHLWVRNFKNGDLMTVTGRGGYIREAKRRAYRTLSNLSTEGIMYRTDIGLNAVDKFREITKLGWIDLKEEQLLEPFKANTISR